MRYPASETAEKHTRILKEASRLFRERGFSGVSVSEIMKSTGLTHGPFYNHFSSKEALMTESLTLEMRGMLADLDQFCASPNGKNKYIQRYLSTVHRDSPGRGCAIAALASEIRHESAVRSPFSVQLKAVIAKLATCFPWRSKRSARSESIQMLCSLVGAVILSRAIDDDAFSTEILKEVQKGQKYSKEMAHEQSK